MENRLKESQEHKHTCHLGSSPGKYHNGGVTRILAVDVEKYGQIEI